ncbi:MAG: threonine ammonia-lyase [Kiritimatiellae bacterium]|nr:threonine ammonia-lyase [Kiritimatiellia bacterium]
MSEVTLEKIRGAAEVLKGVARRTDMIYAPKLSTRSQVYLKTENLQVTGSFKVRGAFYKISTLSKEELERGVIACSAGNHAQGVALGAQQRGAKAIICMPDIAPIAKVEATKSYGAEVRLVPGTYDDASAYAAKVCAEKGMTFVHPFDDPDVIAGQGTVGLEILEQLPDVEAVMIPVGGGGLISGVAYAIKQLKPDCKVYGVEAAEAASMKRSVEANDKLTLASANTFADGIAVKHPGDLTFDMVNQYVDGIVTVSEDEIAAAILFLIEQRKLVCEGAGAVSVAAMIYDKVPELQGKKVCCLLSGGNIDVNILSRVIYRGLQASGRRAEIRLSLPDKPGQLAAVSEIVSKCGGNVIGVNYGPSAMDTALATCVLNLQLETRNFEQIGDIHAALEAAGYHLLRS